MKFGNLGLSILAIIFSILAICFSLPRTVSIQPLFWRFEQ